MFSHRWQPPEPSFQMVENTVIYGLVPTSPTVDKLIKFCNLVQSRSFRWAWSDTCCVNQSDKGVQQESVVAMFQWYCRAALTIVHLLGVFSESQEPGSLWKSIWNTRGWTYQEYVASRVIQFYTEDWKPYLGLEMFNHKESPIILAEMEQATKFTTRALATLQPGLTRVREKLYLASKRQTTRKEDIAYCLFGIFDVALPVIYGEGTRAVRRLLEHILTQSGNVTLLSWTRAGNSSSSANSYLPADLTVYDQIEPPHVPQPIETAEMDRMTMALQSSLPDPSLAVQLYERLHSLPSLAILSGRLHLPGFVFSLTSLTSIAGKRGSDSRIHVYHATTPILGNIRIETNDDLVGMHGLVLIHPWISPLLDRDFSGGAAQFDLTMRALRLVVRLKQPFGALLLALEGRALYKRVATDSLIKVQIREETALEELMDSIRIVDVQ
jgi:hypothetical protein